MSNKQQAAKRAEDRSLYALTLHRPWPWAICYANKRVENRTWKPPVSLIGCWIAIHAGKTFDRECAADIDAPEEAERHPLGIVALAKLVGVAEDGSKLSLEQCISWWIGPVGWLLDNVIVFDKPVPCKGAQGLWVVTGDALEQCREQFRRSKLATKADEVKP